MLWATWGDSHCIHRDSESDAFQLVATEEGRSGLSSCGHQGARGSRRGLLHAQELGYPAPTLSPTVWTCYPLCILGTPLSQVPAVTHPKLRVAWAILCFTRLVLTIFHPRASSRFSKTPGCRWQLLLLLFLAWVISTSLGLLRGTRTATFMASEKQGLQGLGAGIKGHLPMLEIPSFHPISVCSFGTGLKFHKRVLN